MDSKKDSGWKDDFELTRFAVQHFWRSYTYLAAFSMILLTAPIIQNINYAAWNITLGVISFNLILPQPFYIQSFD